jgi:hypothetical protein
MPHEALYLKRDFDVETEWDGPDKRTVGSKEVDIQFDDVFFCLLA